MVEHDRPAALGTPGESNDVVSQGHLRMILASVADVAFEIAPDNTCSWVSPSVREALGWEPGDLAGTAMTDLVHPDDAPVLLAFQQGASQGRPGRLRIRLRDTRGGHRLYECVLNGALGDAGHAIGGVIGWRDVQDEQQALEALRASEREYRLIAENVGDVVIRTGPDLVVGWVSPALREVSGWSPEAMVGRPAWEFVHPDDLPALKSAIADVQDGHAGSASAQGRFRHSDGAYQHWSIFVRQAIDETGRACGLIVTLQNIDLEVRARERAAQEAGHRFAVVESMLDPHVLLEAVRDDAGRIVDFIYADANDAACEYNRSPRAQLVGASLMQLLPGHAGTGLFDQYCHTVNTGEPLVLDDFVYPHEILAEPRHFDIRGVRVGDALSFTWRDVTSRAETEARIVSSEARYRTLVERMAHVTVLTDSQGLVRYVSEAVTDLLGYDVDELVGLSMLDLVHPDDRAGVVEAEGDLRATGTHEDRIRLRRRDGSYRWVESTDRPQFAADGSLTAVIGVWRDAAATHAGDVIAEHVGDPVFRLTDCSVSWVSPSVPRQLGGTQDQWIGVNLRDRIHPEDLPILQDAVKHLSQGRTSVARVRMLGLDRIYRWVDGTGSPTEEPAVVVLSVHVVDEDVSREEALQRLAGSDGLTGLSNRRTLMLRLEAVLSKWRTGHRTGLLFCDLDNLKQINDTAGHAAGDAVISAVAQRIQSAVRRDDICARFGGDEFVVVLIGLHGLHQAVIIAEKIRQAATEPVRISDGSTVTPSLSVGVTLAHEEEGSTDVLDRADTAMYDAKASGRNKVAAIE